MDRIRAVNTPRDTTGGAPAGSLRSLHDRITDKLLNKRKGGR